MKKNIYLLTLFTALLFTSGLSAQQVSMHPTGAITDSSAILDIIATDKGLLIPRMDSTSRNNIAGPAKGLMVFDSTYNSFWYFDGMAWTSINGLDQQDLRLSNDSLYLTNDISAVLLGDFKQDLSITNDTLHLSNAPTAIDMSVYPDNLGNHIATQNLQLNNHFLNNDGGVGEGIYVDTLGHVKMNKSNAPNVDVNFHYEFDLPATTLAINQSVPAYNIFVQNGIPYWQSFTIPHDGLLTHFIYYGEYNSSNIPAFALYKGEGTSGELLASGVPSRHLFYGQCILSNIPVSQGEVYTMWLHNPNVWDLNFLNTLNPYPGGRSNHHPDYDVRFAVNIIQPYPGYRFTDTALVLNEYQLPIIDGNPNEILVADGAGKVSWVNASNEVLVDQLGNHSMTQGLQMNGYWVNNDGDANEGLYIDTAGRVGVNIIPEAILHVPMGAAPNPGFRVNDTGVTINEYSLPMVDGTANQALATDGAGVLNWVTTAGSSSTQQLSLSNDTLSLTNGGPPISLTPYAGAGNLGNHTASQNLYIDTFAIHNTATDTTGMFLNNFNSLHVVSSSARPIEFLITEPAVGNYIEINNNANTRALLGAGGSDFIPGGDTLALGVGNFSGTGGFNMWVGSAKRVQISAVGNVGIGRAATTNILEVEGTASKSTAGNWLANSDARLKKNIQQLDSHDMLDKLLSLQGISYEWADDQTDMQRPVGIQHGFTAQNIQEVFPTLVSEDQQGYLQTAYGTYDAMTIEAIRALNHKLEKLDSKTSMLEQEMDAMAELRSKIQESRARK